MLGGGRRSRFVREIAMLEYDGPYGCGDPLGGKLCTSERPVSESRRFRNREVKRTVSRTIRVCKDGYQGAVSKAEVFRGRTEQLTGDVLKDVRVCRYQGINPPNVMLTIRVIGSGDHSVGPTAEGASRAGELEGRIIVLGLSMSKCSWPAPDFRDWENL